MPRKAKPYWHRGGWYTEAGGGRKLLARGEGAYDLACRELERLLAEQARCRERGLPAAGELPLLELAELYLDHVKATLSESTYKVRRAGVRELLKLAGGKKSGQVRPADVARMKQAMLARGVGPTAVNMALASVRRMYNWAHREAGLVGPHSPARHVPGLPEVRRQRVAAHSEYAALLKAASPALRDVLVCLRHTSARPGELRGLRRRHVQTGQGLIVFGEHKTARTARGALKGAPRVIAFPQEAREVFERRLAAYPEPGPDDLVFTNTRGRPWKKTVLGKVFADARAKAGLDLEEGEQLVLYSSRHTYLTEAARAGLSAMQLQLLGGWTSLKMAQQYVHLSGRDVAEAAEKTAEAIRRAGNHAPPP